jgi:hypothetical protein
MKKIIILFLLIYVSPAFSLAEPENYNINYKVGFESQNIQINKSTIGNFVCYEHIYTDLRRARIRVGNILDLGFTDGAYSASSRGIGFVVSDLHIKPLQRNISLYMEYGLGMFTMYNTYTYNEYYGPVHSKDYTMHMGIGLLSLGLRFFDSQYFSLGVNAGYLFSYGNYRNYWNYPYKLDLGNLYFSTSVNFCF